MTVAELYFYAKSKGLEHKPIIINYEADDGWYSLFTEITKDNIRFTKKKVELVF